MRSRQRGVVLIFTLIVLLILTIGAVALMRSMNTSLLGAGNLAFRRDLVNQGEQAVANVMTQFQAGGLLSTSGSATVDVPSLNYSASILLPNAEGVPNILLSNDTTFQNTWTASDLAGPAGSGITMRYIIDRLCAPGTTTPNGGVCVESSAAPTGGKAGSIGAVAAPAASVYRLTVRVSGPRSSQIFLQTTFTRAD